MFTGICWINLILEVSVFFGDFGRNIIDEGVALFT